MSAECEKHGCDLVGHQFSEGGLQCPQCKLDAVIYDLQKAIIEHRTATRNAGTVKVQSGYEEVAEAKNRIDNRLWSALNDKPSGVETAHAGAWEVLLVLVCMADDHELEGLISTLSDEGRDDALAALAQARKEIEGQIANYNERRA